MAEPAAPSLVADCEQCFALCCVLLPFSAESGFGQDKAGGTPCPQLADDDRCTIHSTLRRDGWSGCVTFDCFGAGQQVSQATYGGVSWRAGGNRGEMAAVLSVMRVLHEMLLHLHEVVRRGPDPTADGLAAEVTAMTWGTPDALLDLDLDFLHDRVSDVLQAASVRLRGATGRPGPDHRGRDLAGRDLRDTDVADACLRGALLIAADLRGVDLGRAELLGADLRDTDLRGADLGDTLFVTQSQVNAAIGDGSTVIPAGLSRPTHWGAPPG